MEPTRLFPVIVLLSLVTVEYRGWALLGFRTGRGTLGAFREQLFRAGHAHAGVLLVLVHLGLGQQGRSTPGTVLTRGGALLIAAALIILAIGLITYG
jgi:hypothetical protein